MASIVSFGRWLPERVLANAELAARLNCDPGWILEMCGIEERRVAGDDDSVEAMGARAGLDCLSRAGVEPRSVGLVIVTSGSSSRRFPGPAAQTALAMGIPGAPAIDLPMASAGGLFAMAMAASLCASYGNVLVIASERMSEAALAEPLDRNVAILFGDGAGACLISRDAGALEIVDSALHSDGTWSDALRLDFSGPVKMDGRTVILQAARKMPAAIAEVLQRNQLQASDVSAFLLHQANLNLLERVAKTLGVPAERFHGTIRRYGNTSSAAMLITASEWMETAQLRSGDPVCFAVFGAGFHWGALLARNTHIMT